MCAACYALGSLHSEHHPIDDFFQSTRIPSLCWGLALCRSRSSAIAGYLDLLAPSFALGGKRKRMPCSLKSEFLSKIVLASLKRMAYHVTRESNRNQRLSLVSMSSRQLAGSNVQPFPTASGACAPAAPEPDAGSYRREGLSLGSLLGVHSLRHPGSYEIYGIVEASIGNQVNGRPHKQNEKHQRGYEEISPKRGISRSADHAPRMYLVAKTDYQSNGISSWRYCHHLGTKIAQNETVLSRLAQETLGCYFRRKLRSESVMSTLINPFCFQAYDNCNDTSAIARIPWP